MTPETWRHATRVYDNGNGLRNHGSKSSWRVNEWARRVPGDTCPGDTCPSRARSDCRDVEASVSFTVMDITVPRNKFCIVHNLPGN
jgi:hypothetical protein